jgi:NTE family protein
VYRADLLGVIRSIAKWLIAPLFGGMSKQTPISLLDNSPLVKLLATRLDIDGIQRSIDAGHLTAFSITCFGYTSGESVTFYQSIPGLKSWQRAHRIGIPMQIRLEHLLASAALPFLFPATRINREYFGDGSMRQSAPVSPALHLGAERLLVIGVGRHTRNQTERVRTEAYPSFAEIAGHCLNSIFLDSLETDLERLQRINRTLSVMPPEVRKQSEMPLQEVDFRVIAPSVALEKIAIDYAHYLPLGVRTWLYPVGALKRSGSNVLTYLLFEQEYCRALIKLGFDDTMKRRDELVRFLGF